MLFKRKFVLYSVLVSSVVLLSGCPLDDEKDEHTASVCNDGAKEITTSDARTVCINLTSFKADAPFIAGYNAPGKTTHTVFVSDSKGSPINVSSDDVLTEISQYPYMTMDTGHKHSAPYREADLSAAEYGAYNLDVYYPMPSKMMDGTSMGKWEYRVLIHDNNGTADDTDDKTHTVAFEPEVKMIMSSKAFRAVGKNESDTFKNAMDVVSNRQYTNWLESVGKVADGAADVKVYVTTQDKDHAEMAMAKVQAREEAHVHDHGDTDADTDSQTYPQVHAPMMMNGSTMTLTLHDAVDNAEVAVSTVVVEVSADNGATWTTLSPSGMTHDDFGYYNASVPMTAGDVTLLVKTTVNGNVMTKTGAAADGVDVDAIPALMFTAAE